MALLRPVAGQVRRFQEGLHAIGHGGRVAAVDEKAALAVDHDIARPAGARGHDRRLPCHGLDERHAERLNVGRVDDAQRAVVDFVDIGRPALKANAIVQAQRGGPSLHFLRSGPVAVEIKLERDFLAFSKAAACSSVAWPLCGSNVLRQARRRERYFSGRSGKMRIDRRPVGNHVEAACAA